MVLHMAARGRRQLQQQGFQVHTPQGLQQVHPAALHARLAPQIFQLPQQLRAFVLGQAQRMGRQRGPERTGGLAGGQQLSQAAVFVLRELVKRGPTTRQDLQAALGMSERGIDKAIGRLIDLRMVETIKEPGALRVTRAITPAGRDALAKAGA